MNPITISLEGLRNWNLSLQGMLEISIALAIACGGYLLAPRLQPYVPPRFGTRRERVSKVVTFCVGLAFCTFAAALIIRLLFSTSESDPVCWALPFTMGLFLLVVCVLCTILCAWAPIHGLYDRANEASLLTNLSSAGICTLSRVFFERLNALAICAAIAAFGLWMVIMTIKPQAATTLPEPATPPRIDA